jgi:hypothetical protein
MVIQSVEDRWEYVVISNGEHYEPYPPRSFDCEDDALKAAAAFCDYRMDNVTPIDGLHRRKETGAIGLTRQTSQS